MKKLITIALLLGAVCQSFAQGFADFDYFCWALNGSTNASAPIVSNLFALTDGTIGENRSAWFQHPLYVGAFQASFTYQDAGGGGADGMAFVIQNDPRGTNALGYDTQGLGYCGITPSVALLLNISSNAPGGPGWMLATNGVGIVDLSDSPTELSYQSTAPLDLTAGNPVNVNISYDGTMLWLSLTDTIAGTAFQTNLPLNIPALANSNTAWVGITGSAGTAASTQIVSNFTFVPLPMLSNAGTNGTNVMFTWPGSIIGYSLQSKSGLQPLGHSLFPPTWQADASPVLLVNGWNQATVTSTNAQYFYRLATARQMIMGGLTAKHGISLNSNAVDSYNSSTAPGGLYSLAVRGDHVRVLTLSTNPGIISIPGRVYGRVVTGAGGEVSCSGAVGDMAWNNQGYHGIELGHSATNAAIQISDVLAPYANGTFPSAGTYNGTNVAYLLHLGNYILPSLSLSGQSEMAVTGNATLYITGGLSTSGAGTIYIAPGASLKLYIGGSVSLTGGGIVNASVFPANCAIYGLSGCSTVKLAGNGDFIGTVYAPDADLTMSGNGSCIGAFTANSISNKGNGSVHFDESLAPSYGW